MPFLASVSVTPAVALRTVVLLGARYLPSVIAGLMDDEMDTLDNLISINLASSILQICFFNENRQSVINKKYTVQA
jgi:hypothetical protein